MILKVMLKAEIFRSRRSVRTLIETSLRRFYMISNEAKAQGIVRSIKRCKIEGTIMREVLELILSGVSENAVSTVRCSFLE